jgi:hypothetical protein
MLACSSQDFKLFGDPPPSALKLTQPDSIAWRGRRLKSEEVVADRTDMDMSAIALVGLEQAQVQLGNAASSLAGATGSPSPSSSDSVDLNDGIVTLMSAKDDCAVNIIAWKTAYQIQKYAIDMMA